MTRFHNSRFNFLRVSPVWELHDVARIFIHHSRCSFTQQQLWISFICNDYPRYATFEVQIFILRLFFIVTPMATNLVQLQFRNFYLFPMLSAQHQQNWMSCLSILDWFLFHFWKQVIFCDSLSVKYFFISFRLSFVHGLARLCWYDNAIYFVKLILWQNVDFQKVEKRWIGKFFVIFREKTFKLVSHSLLTRVHLL